MKLIITLLALAFLASCGHESKDNEIIGQVKKVKNNTPLLCPDYNDADISLGVIRNGVGSVSREDVWVYIKNESDLAKFKEANETGKLVKIVYSQWRFTLCLPERYVTKIEIIN